MDIKEAVRSLELKFTSGNDIPVGRATVTREEWEAVKEMLMKECKSCKHWTEDHIHEYVVPGNGDQTKTLLVGVCSKWPKVHGANWYIPEGYSCADFEPVDND
jgi:hypothetical protein